MLNHALEQTGWTGPLLDQTNWRAAVRNRLQSVDWKKAVGDVKPFLESQFNVEMLTQENLVRLLQDV